MGNCNEKLFYTFYENRNSGYSAQESKLRTCLPAIIKTLHDNDLLSHAKPSSLTYFCASVFYANCSAFWKCTSWKCLEASWKQVTCTIQCYFYISHYILFNIPIKISLYISATSVKDKCFWVNTNSVCHTIKINGLTFFVLSWAQFSALCCNL